LSIHEYAHARVARAQGDHTADELGRVTLNPIYHIHPIGTIVVPLALLLFSQGRIAFGWAKPVPVNLYAFRHPRRGLFLVSLAGPGSNVCLALVCGIALRLLAGAPDAGFMQALTLILASVTMLNLYLAFFNLIPIPPFDGSGVVSALLPVEYAQKYEALGRYGTILVLGLLIIGGFGGRGLIGLIAGVPARLLYMVFTGQAPY
jgi:Zn-dependent protease